MAEVLLLSEGKYIERLICIDNIITLNDEEKNKILLNEFENEINEEDVEMKFTFEETNYAQVLRRNAMEQGKTEGKIEGKSEGIYMVAKNMLREGISIELISKTTSLPKEKIVEISKLKA